MKTSHLVAAVAATSLAGAAAAVPITLTSSGSITSVNPGAFTELAGVSVSDEISISLTYESSASVLAAQGQSTYYDAITSYVIEVNGTEIDLADGNAAGFGGDTRLDQNIFNGFGQVDRLNFGTAPTLSAGTISSLLFIQFPLSTFGAEKLGTIYDSSAPQDLLSDSFFLTSPGGSTGDLLVADMGGWDVEVSVIPVPPAAAMGLIGLVGAGVMRRRRLASA